MKKPRKFKSSPPSDASDFASFRDKWLRNLLRQDVDIIPSGAKIVGARLSLYMHQDKQFAHPSYLALSEEVGLGVRIVQKHTLALEKAGFIFVDRRRNAGNFYFLDAFWDKDAKKSSPSRTTKP